MSATPDAPKGLVRTPWFERRFAFDLTIAAAPGLLERLRGTPARVEERLRGLPAAWMTARDGEHWSIQENVGHLWDLEPLWFTRVGELAESRPVLQATDLKNRRTHEANHNARAVDELCLGFRAARLRLVERLETADGSLWLRSALHPRLNTPMRLLDLAQFVAEHDDHHLATITGLMRKPPSP